ARAAREGGAAPAHRDRDGVPELQPLRPHDGARERRRGAPASARRAAARGRGPGPGAADPGGPVRQGAGLSASALRRPAAAGRDRPGPRPGPEGAAVRRTHQRPGPGAGRGGAGGDPLPRPRRHHARDRHPRDPLRPRRRRHRGLHGPRPDRRAGPARGGPGPSPPRAHPLLPAPGAHRGGDTALRPRHPRRPAPPTARGPFMTPLRTPARPPSASRPLSRRSLAASGLLLPAAVLAACSDPAPAASGDTGSEASDGGGDSGPGIDTSGTQELIRGTADESIAALLPPEIAESGVLRVGINGTSSAPLSFLADDNQTYIGSEIDIARIVADTFGLEFELKLTTWENWPLKLEAGEFDVVHANIGVNAERLEKFDFASYRAAYMSFLVKKGADFWLEDADSLSGRIIAVSPATNQERILTDWNAELEAAGKEPATLKNYSTTADPLVALGSGRVDGYLSPYASLSFIAARRDDFELQGRINAGWPDETLVAATFARSSGLAEPYAAALNTTMADGSYDRVLQRWQITDEALPSSRAHTKEQP